MEKKLKINDRTVLKAIDDLVTKNIKGSSSLRDVEKHLITKEKMRQKNHEKFKKIIRRLFDEKKILPLKPPIIPVTVKFVRNHMHSVSAQEHSRTDEDGLGNGHLKENQIPSTSKKVVPSMPSNRPKYVLPSVPKKKRASHSKKSTDHPKNKPKRSIFDTDSSIDE